MAVPAVRANMQHINLPSGEPATETWRNKATYGDVLVEKYLKPLEATCRSFGKVPVRQQLAVLQSLQWYFTVDSRERAPTVVVDEAMAIVFHATVSRIMQHIELTTILALDVIATSIEVKHALLSYKYPCCHSPVVLDAYDQNRRLACVTYYLHGDKPTEVFLVNGQPIKPAFTKYRACKFFRRSLLTQRIVWLPAAQNSHIEIVLAGQATDVAEPSGGLAKQVSVVNASRQVTPLPFTRAGLAARLLSWLAGLPLVRKRFEHAWVFIDRDSEGGDNAEQLYRWVRQQHPEINAWFLLTRCSSDWERLAVEGFNLIEPGIQRTLLLLNCEHLISSHAEYSAFTFSHRVYGRLMTCTYSFIPHGISKDDVSNWLNAHRFDYVASTCSGEYESFVGDDTAYIYTNREVALTGFPRQDILHAMQLAISEEDIKILLIMPTWRSSLAAYDATSTHGIQEVSESNYVRHWSAVLRSAELASMAAQNGLQIVFMPHHNLIPLLDAFVLPTHVKLLRKFSKETLCKSVALLTDYSSVAFELAGLRRPTFYYQFDRDKFYAGDHNWREGYFDYTRDGFGPIAFQQDELMTHLREFIANDIRPSSKYLTRMEQAMPLTDGGACGRVFKGIVNARRPFSAGINLLQINAPTAVSDRC